MIRLLPRILLTIGVFGSLFGCSSKPEQPVFMELTPTDIAQMDRQRAIVASIALQRYNISRLTKTRADLETLQKILDDKVFGKTQTYELQCLGVVFGDILASESSLRWVLVTDEYGTDPTLRFKNTTLQINALTMISKRVEDDEKIDVTALFNALSRQIEELKNTPMAT